MTTLAQHAKQQTTNLLVLGSLVGLALWGHASDWTFTRFESSVQRHTRAVAPLVDKARPTTEILGREATPAGSALATSQLEIEVPAHDEAELTRNGICLGHPEQRAMHEEVLAHGLITYMQTRTANLSARVPGTVWSVHCEVGDLVQEDEVLAILDAAEVGQAKANFLQALVAAEVAQATLDRIKAIGDAVPENRIRELDALARRAFVERYNAQQALINLGLPVQFEELQTLSDGERSRRVQFLALPERITRRLDHRTTTANLLPIVAPFHGVVIRRELVVGEIVSPQQAELAVADVSRMWLRLNISKEDALRVEVGQPVSFAATGLQEPIASTISWISTEADTKTRTVEALAVVDNPVLDDDDQQGQRLLKANTFGTVRVRVLQQDDAVVVPNSAIHQLGDTSVVFVPVTQQQSSSPASGYRFRAQPVELGVRSATGVQVVAGLDPESPLVVEGGQMIKSELQRRQERGQP